MPGLSSENRTVVGKSRLFSGNMDMKTFRRISEFISNEIGIKMPPNKKSMLESRLFKRLRALGLVDYDHYCEYLFSPEGAEKEIYHLINVVTTHTTEFFREPNHFRFLSDHVLPEWHSKNKNKVFTVWSAGCSSGEEPYSLGITLCEFAENNPDFRFAVVASDVSVPILEMAAKGIYPEEKVRLIPREIRKKYLLRSKNKTDKLIRVAPGIRKHIRFYRLNLTRDFKLKDTADAIFCRNVLIYFERHKQREIVLGLCANLRPGGHLFIGHSESLNGMKLPLAPAKPTIYKKV